MTDWAIQERRNGDWFTVRTDIPQDEVLGLRQANNNDGSVENTDYRFIPAPIKPVKTPKPKG